VPTCFIGLVAALSLAPDLATAGSGGGSSDGSVYAHATEPGSVNTVPTHSPARGPRCSWEVAYINSIVVDVPGGRQAGIGEAASHRDAETKQEVSAAGPGVETLYVVRCPYGTGTPQYRWAAPAQYIDRQAVINAAYDEAVASVPLPSLNISPRPEVGVPAQLGIWLAVDDPGQVNALAQVGPVWASVTARFVGMTWDMGNGDAVECTGLGTPYPEGSGTYEQGPCGYTYTRVGDAGVRRVSAVGHWEVQLVTSDGVDQHLDPIDRSFEFDYEVYEIVTVVEG
jgi:hypothetical protein